DVGLGEQRRRRRDHARARLDERRIAISGGFARACLDQNLQPQLGQLPRAVGCRSDPAFTGVGLFRNSDLHRYSDISFLASSVSSGSGIACLAGFRLTRNDTRASRSSSVMPETCGMTTDIGGAMGLPS